MNEIVMYMLAVACMAALSVMLCSCDDKIDVQQAYDFRLTCWHLQSDIRNGEAVEIRLTLHREGDYAGASYNIGYIQMEGRGEVYDRNNVLLVNREPLCEIQRTASVSLEMPDGSVTTISRDMGAHSTRRRFPQLSADL